MGNRAVIAFESMPEIGIYVHWNGGPESVMAFLDATRERGAPTGVPSYAFAALVSTITAFLYQPNMFGMEPEINSVGVGPLSQLDTDNYDNGLYWIGPTLQITRRDYVRSAHSATCVSHLSPEEREKYSAIKAECLKLTDYSEEIRALKREKKA